LGERFSWVVCSEPMIYGGFRLHGEILFFLDKTLRQAQGTKPNRNKYRVEGYDVFRRASEGSGEVGGVPVRLQPRDGVGWRGFAVGWWGC